MIRKVLLLGALVAAFSAACIPKPPSYPKRPLSLVRLEMTPEQQYARALIDCLPAPDLNPECLSSTIKYGRLAGKTDCVIRGNLEGFGYCRADINRALALDKTPVLSLKQRCDWDVDPCNPDNGQEPAS